MQEIGIQVWQSVAAPTALIHRLCHHPIRLAAGQKTAQTVLGAVGVHRESRPAETGAERVDDGGCLIATATVHEEVLGMRRQRVAYEVAHRTA